MIVNPQLFNYKLIIGSLIVALVALSVFSFTTYESEKAQQHFLKQEQQLVEHELSEMLDKYDAISDSSDLLSQQLMVAKNSTKSALEKLRLLEGDFSVFSRFKSDFSELKSRNNVLFKTIDSLASAHNNLKLDHQNTVSSLNQEKKSNASLLETNATLNKKIESGSKLTANSIQATVFKIGIPSVETSKASQANRIDVCFTLAENALTEPGSKEIYIQILNPLNNVIADKGAITFGESLLLYSDKQLITYNNKSIQVCTSIVAKENDKPFAKGVYFVNVFHKDRKLGATQVVLN
ncbi:hypothetical protein ES711_03325 [Gelidibacter salicanalis]|uniref:Chromosome partitioning protein ParA n=1 Tax=Gelidibacter salicanalis TaxID=291193 RepID=A0A5C7AMH5_9FLAO|nr:hypothetical protein [Gelidibacter salicanalis]TXE08979.1 hypothetical protein ES711_03325 [Gelidibacter salicanalis]